MGVANYTPTSPSTPNGCLGCHAAG
jgi:hypothetical protein